MVIVDMSPKRSKISKRQRRLRRAASRRMRRQAQARANEMRTVAAAQRAREQSIARWELEEDKKPDDASPRKRCVQFATELQIATIPNVPSAKIAPPVCAPLGTPIRPPSPPPSPPLPPLSSIAGSASGAGQNGDQELVLNSNLGTQLRTLLSQAMQQALGEAAEEDLDEETYDEDADPDFDPDVDDDSEGDNKDNSDPSSEEDSKKTDSKKTNIAVPSASNPDDGNSPASDPQSSTDKVPDATTNGNGDDEIAPMCDVDPPSDSEPPQPQSPKLCTKNSPSSPVSSLPPSPSATTSRKHRRISPTRVVNPAKRPRTPDTTATASESGDPSTPPKPSPKRKKRRHSSSPKSPNPASASKSEDTQALSPSSEASVHSTPRSDASASASDVSNVKTPPSDTFPGGQQKVKRGGLTPVPVSNASVVNTLANGSAPATSAAPPKAKTPSPSKPLSNSQTVAKSSKHGKAKKNGKGGNGNGKKEGGADLTKAHTVAVTAAESPVKTPSSVGKGKANGSVSRSGKPESKCKNEGAVEKTDTPPLVEDPSIGESKDGEIDDLFATFSKARKAKRVSAGKTGENGKVEAMKGSSPSASGRKTNGMPRFTEEGYRIMTMDDIMKDQPPGLDGDCPFDCSCCF